MTTVLEVIRQGEVGGGESHVIDLVERLAGSDIRPVVVAYTDGPMISSLRQQGIVCHVVPTLKAFDTRVWKRLEQIARDEKAAIIHAHGTRAASNLLWAARATKLPLVYTVHGWSFHPDQPGIVRWLRGASEKLICRMARRVICVSQTNMETGLHAFRLNLRKTEVIENGVNTSVFSPSRNDLEGLRHDFGFDASDVVTGFVARATKQKDPLLYVQGVEKAHQQDARIKGLFVGEGDLRTEVENYIRNHRLHNVIKLSPFRSDVPRVLQAIDVYCLPSLWEGLSIALLEAMAMSKAVVVTPTDGAREIVNNGENGLLVPFGDAEALAQTLVQCAADPEKREAMGREARRLVLNRFDSQRVADHVINIYHDLTS